MCPGASKHLIQHPLLPSHSLSLQQSLPGLIIQEGSNSLFLLHHDFPKLWPIPSASSSLLVNQDIRSVLGCLLFLLDILSLDNLTLSHGLRYHCICHKLHVYFSSPSSPLNLRSAQSIALSKSTCLQLNSPSPSPNKQNTPQKKRKKTSPAPVSVNGTTIFLVVEARKLGVILDSALYFTHHPYPIYQQVLSILPLKYLSNIFTSLQSYCQSFS